MKTNEFTKFTNVREVWMRVNKEDLLGNKKDSLDINLIFDRKGSHQRSFNISVKDNKLVIGEGFICCPYIPDGVEK